MLISTSLRGLRYNPLLMFQSLDWVDVDFDTSIMAVAQWVDKFQSLDWVDVDFDLAGRNWPQARKRFQSLDWVDVDFDFCG